jgi:hypothetical protein
MNARSFFLRTALTLVAVTAAALPARAQDASLTSTVKTPLVAQGDSGVKTPLVAQGDSVAPAAVGPTRESASVAFRSRTEENRTPAAPPARGGFSHGETLMIVGAAAILTGIVIGNDAGHAISVAGAVIGLIGLYQYLQ